MTTTNNQPTNKKKYTKETFYVGATVRQTEHWIACDDLDARTLGTYILLKGMANRTDAAAVYNIIPMSLTALALKLGYSQKVFREIYKTLYEFGLIEFVEFKDKKYKGNKMVNIVINDAPYGNDELLNKPYERLRSYTDYTAANASSKGKGGRPKKELVAVQESDAPSSGVVFDENSVVPSKEHTVVTSGEHESFINKSNHLSKNPLKSFVNKQRVNNSPDTPVEKEFTEQQIENIFRSKVQDSAFRHYPKMRNERKMTKPGFIALVDQFVTETIRDGRHMGINNLDKYVDGFFKRVQGHHNYQMTLAANHVETIESSYSISMDRTQGTSLPSGDVPTMEELEELLAGLAG